MLDAEQPASYGGCPVASFQARSPQSAQKLRERGFVAGWQAQIAQLAIQRSRGSIRHAGDAASVEIQHRERLENVVELAGCEGNRDVLVAANLAQMLEVPDAVLIKNHALHGQLVGIAGFLSGRRREHQKKTHGP